MKYLAVANLPMLGLSNINGDSMVRDSELPFMERAWSKLHSCCFDILTKRRARMSRSIRPYLMGGCLFVAGVVLTLALASCRKENGGRDDMTPLKSSEGRHWDSPRATLN